MEWDSVQISEPIDECDAREADLFLDVPHECEVGGNTVVIRSSDWIPDSVR